MRALKCDVSQYWTNILPSIALVYGVFLFDAILFGLVSAKHEYSGDHYCP